MGALARIGKALYHSITANFVCYDPREEREKSERRENARAQALGIPTGF